MSRLTKYIPILRSRQQEFAVLKSFDFGYRIFPYLEIIKERDRDYSNKKYNKKPKEFEEFYIPFISSIKANLIFIDLPNHLQAKRSMKQATIEFLTSIVANRVKRTEYVIKLAKLSDKIIPVISSYYSKTREKDSIILQERDLRAHYKTLAFRVFETTVERDLQQIYKVIRPQDFIFMDWEESSLEKEDPRQIEIAELLKESKCNVVIHKNAFAKDISNVKLEHGKVVKNIDNTLLDKFSQFGGQHFSDYAGIKKDDISDGGTISPGFVYYSASENLFYGFKGVRKDLQEFETTIIPDIISSPATKKMKTSKLDYLSTKNKGWEIINNINEGIESGKSAAKFKRIGLEHYLFCLKKKIENEVFD